MVAWYVPTLRFVQDVNPALTITPPRCTHSEVQQPRKLSHPGTVNSHLAKKLEAAWAAVRRQWQSF